MTEAEIQAWEDRAELELDAEEREARDLPALLRAPTPPATPVERSE